MTALALQFDSSLGDEMPFLEAEPTRSNGKNPEPESSAGWPAPGYGGKLVINIKTAKALGLTNPPGVLAIADEVIE